jgi:diguanylate cyclase (GGDEF)-like protein
VTYSILTDLLHATPFPSPADALYLAGYPMLLTGVVLLIRWRTPDRDRASLLDATIIATGFGLLAWVFVLAPAATDTTVGLLARLVSLAYPLLDVLLLALLSRLLFSAGMGNPAFRLATLALLLQLVGDVVYAAMNLLGRYQPGPVDAAWQACYVLWGAAALHPSMRRVTDRALWRARRFRRGRLVLLASASLLAPTALGVQAVRHQYGALLVIAGGCALLFVLVVTRISGLVGQVEDQAARLEALAHVDELTGIPNRRAWELQLARALARADRRAAAIHVALLDLDHFKRFNDRYGHQAGDRLLTEAASAWRQQLRPGDLLARYGGEEFGVVLDDCGLAEAVDVLQRLRGCTPLGQTLSAGVATWDRVETAQGLVARADLALYQAKRGGRDRVVAASPDAAVLAAALEPADSTAPS